jgi:DNA-binding IclR family transcriptional regulator
LFDTGSGHILLAFRSTKERQRMVAENTGGTGDDPRMTPEFLARLELIRSRGYEMMPSAQTAGVINLSAPIIGADGMAIAALTAPYITLINNPSAPDISATIQLLGVTAHKLSEMAGAGFTKDAY